ncbi:helix-turn-helix domain-containing protein [Halolamina salifodinae]|uniref:DNA-binding CsgD family transcriptional regulator n=1 Tax=Halolamina salifodinae TaxID=1202767 RepID=A0A8T4GZQ7_9EURY|nr:helix-turn-helix domain-containing protein [Halolamina salifodinae]MBP1987024.1 DNA-binding CsgD family transcriptional regulator [Halolamina salifodinae]
MASGIRATVAFAAPTGCPVARSAVAADAAVESVATSVSANDRPVTEFLLDSPADGVDAEPVFSYGDTDVYRVEHAGECPCSCLGSFGCPIHRYVAEPGDLTLVFHAESFERLQEVMATLREEFPSADVKQLLQPPLSGSPDDRRFVNRGKLTDRQLEVLRAAYREGYFERPKGANATELAEELGISRSTFTEHLVAAQRKLFADVFDEG